MTTIMSAAWLLTVVGVSGAANGVDASIGANTVVGASTTGATLGGKMLENIELLNNNLTNEMSNYSLCIVIID